MVYFTEIPVFYFYKRLVNPRININSAFWNETLVFAQNSSCDSTCEVKYKVFDTPQVIPHNCCKVESDVASLPSWSDW